MATTDARPVPLKNTAFRVTFPIYDADGDLVTGATGLDSEVSKDNGTFADCTNEATEVATSSGIYYLDLTASEMNADNVTVIVKTTSSGAKTTVLTLYPKEAGDITVVLEGVTHTGAVVPTVTAVTNGVTLATSAVQAIWDALTSALTTSGSIGKRIVDYLTGDAYSRLGSPAGASVSADIAATKALLPTSLSGGRIRAAVEDLDAKSQSQIGSGVLSASVDGLSVEVVLTVLTAMVAGSYTKVAEGDGYRYTFKLQDGVSDAFDALVEASGRSDVTISV